MSLPNDAPAPPLSAVEQLAYRITQRDAPAPASLSMTPEAVRERLGQALGRRLGTKDPRRRRTLAHFVYALMAEPRLSNAQLGAAAGITPQAAQRVADGLRAAGLLDVAYEKNVRYQRLSRAGEDWVLPVAQGVA